MELRKVLQLARKWFWPIVFACVIGGVAGMTVRILQPKIYESDTQLYFNSPNHTDYNSLQGDQLAAKAFASLPESNSVLMSTLQASGDKNLSLPEFASMVTITNNSNSQYVALGVRDKDPQRATRLVRELAHQSMILFESTDSGQTRTFVQQELTDLTNEIKYLEHQIATTQSQTDATSISQLSANLSADRALFNQLLSSYNLMSDTQITIVQDAQVQQSPFSQSKTFAIAIGAIVGLIAILSVIILLEQTDDVLRTAEKVSRATGLSTFISVAYLPAIAKQTYQLNSQYRVAEHDDEVTGTTDTVRLDPAMLKHALLLAKQPKLTEGTILEAIGVEEMCEAKDDTGNHQPAIAKQASLNGLGHKTKENVSNGFHIPEGFLTLGALLSGESVQLSSNGDSIRSLLISSAEKGDGKTLVASQIAFGLARVGVDVVLLDAHLRDPEIHKLFELSNEVGLSSLLTCSRKLDSSFIFSVLQKTHEPHMAILPSGPAIDSPSALLSSPRMVDVLHVLSEKALIIVDSPAVLAASDTVILAKKCDSILMVVDARRTKTTVLRRALEILTQVNPSITGVVLNRTSGKD